MHSPSEEAAIAFYQMVCATGGAALVVRAFVAPRPDVCDLVPDTANVLYHFDGIIRANERSAIKQVAPPVAPVRRGKGPHGRRRLLSSKQIKLFKKAMRAGERIGEISKAAGVSVMTVRRYCGSRRAYAKAHA